MTEKSEQSRAERKRESAEESRGTKTYPVAVRAGPIRRCDPRCGIMPRRSGIGIGEEEGGKRRSRMHTGRGYGFSLAKLRQ